MTFDASRILYEDNHIMVVNKLSGELVQPDPDGNEALEDTVKAFIKVRDNKPGNVFLGVVHRLDRPVSGALLFAKTSKALIRLNETLRSHGLRKTYWAITEQAPEPPCGTLRHHIVRDGKTNKSRCSDRPTPQSKEAILEYNLLGKSTNYALVEVGLITGRHHQIRCQLSKIGCPLKGDLKYGAARSNPNGSISLHARSISFPHPVSGETITVTAPTDASDNLWSYFESLSINISDKRYESIF